MFYQRPVHSIEEHQAVYDYVDEVLNHFGHPSDRSGLDRNARSGNQSFYMPCTNRDHKDWWFFETHWTRERELALYSIDPAFCIELAGTVKHPVRKENLPTGYATPDHIKAICDVYLTVEDGTNKLGMKTVCRLARAGLSDHEIEYTMKKLSGGDRKKLKRIPGYIKSLTKYRTKW